MTFTSTVKKKCTISTMKWTGLLYSVKQSIFFPFLWLWIHADRVYARFKKHHIATNWNYQLVNKEGTVLQCGPYCTDHSCVILLVRERPLLESYVFTIFKHSELLWCNSQILCIILLLWQLWNINDLGGVNQSNFLWLNQSTFSLMVWPHCFVFLTD